MTWPAQFQSADVIPALGCAVGAYAIGCIATGYYLVRACTGRDIREVESGNIGARNVGRVLGRTGFWLTVLGDFAKGSLAVWAARHFTGSNQFAAIAMLCVVAGHIWPAPLHWRGGKGVVTSGGAAVIYDFQLALAYGVVVLIGYVFTRRTTLPGLAAYLILPVVSYWLHHSLFEATIMATLAALILFAHRQNLIQEFPALAFRLGMSEKPHHPKS